MAKIEDLIKPRDGEGKGTLPGYLSAESARRVVHFKIGNRLLSVAEEADMLLAGFSREEVAKITSKKLKSLANSGGVDESLLLGS